ncbi:leukocyte immunoglobulin-like receptor subfamily B member 3-like protein, partial [Cricetulus griseus]
LTLGHETPVLAGTFPKPILTVQPDSVVSKHTNVTFLCEGTTGAKEYCIYKDGGQYTHFIQFLRMRKKSQNEAEFSISKTDEHHAGQYHCCCQNYDGQSECSDSVELVVTGAYSKPNLSVQPSPVVTEGGNVTFQCDSREQFDRFILTMEGPQKLSWMQGKQYNNSAELFQSLFSVGPVTSRQRWTFRCYGFDRKRPQVWSEPSDTLELLISGTLHKPTIKAEPGPVIAYKSAVTIWCQGSLDARLYVLHKQGSPKHWGTESPEGFGERAKFSMPSVTEEHVGHYQCYSYSSAGWSEPSDNLEIVVTGFYHNKPILSALSGPVATLGGILTLQCVSQDKYQKLILTKKDEKFSSSLEDSQDIYTHEHSTATFSMSPVTPAHRGIFRCYGYRMDTPQLWTVSSDPLEIHISGLSKKPSLLTLQGHILDPGKSLTLQCCSDINYDRFVLHKVRESDFTQNYGQRTHSGLSLANFTLGSVSNSTGGQYRCYGAHNLSSELSAPSDALDIMITGQLPFTSFLSVKPNSTVHPGDNVTFLCWSRNPTDNFIVYKNGTDHQPKQLKSKFQDGHFQAEFSMSGVTSTFSGRYRCYSSLDSSLHLLSNASSPVEITVSESMEVSSHQPLKPTEASSRPPLKLMEASSPPPLKPMEASSPPPLKPMEASSPPPLRPMEAYSCPPLKPMEASSPPPLRPMETSSPPPLRPMEFSSLPSLKPMEASRITPLEPRETA